jgi:hypothetical protein
MIYFSYTNQKTGRVIEVSADTQSGGRSKFENAYRAVVDAKGDRKVNTLRSVAADDGGTVGDAVVSGPCASDRHLVLLDGRRIGPFSSHWAASAIRRLSVSAAIGRMTWRSSRPRHDPARLLTIPNGDRNDDKNHPYRHRLGRQRTPCAGS